MTQTAIQPPAATQSRRQRMRGPVLAIGGLALATVALHLRDPHESGAWGFCPSAALGIYCPGCGGLRAVNDLTDGHLAAAASSNLLLIVLMPFAIAGLALWAVDRWRGTSHAVPEEWRRPLVVASGVVLVVFVVLRNLPGSWLAP